MRLRREKINLFHPRSRRTVSAASNGCNSAPMPARAACVGNVSAINGGGGEAAAEKPPAKQAKKGGKKMFAAQPQINNRESRKKIKKKDSRAAAKRMALFTAVPQTKNKK